MRQPPIQSEKYNIMLLPFSSFVVEKTERSPAMMIREKIEWEQQQQHQSMKKYLIVVKKRRYEIY